MNPVQGVFTFPVRGGVQMPQKGGSNGLQGGFIVSMSEPFAKKADTQMGVCFFVAGRDSKRAATPKAGQKNMPATCFLARGRVPWIHDGSP